MEITSFVLGMLTVVAVTMVTVIVIGIVKIVKLQKLIKESNAYFETCIQNIHQTERENIDMLYRDIQSEHADTWHQFEATGRDITTVERTLQNQIQEEVTVSKRYIDSRIDKLIDSYFDVKEAEQQTKKLIKG